MFDEDKKYKGVPVPSTADGWELYDLPGKDAVAQALYKASTEAIDMIEEAKLADINAVQSKAAKHIYDACVLHEKFGAADSEGLYHARHVVIDAFSAIAGIKIDPWSL